MPKRFSTIVVAEIVALLAFGGLLLYLFIGRDQSEPTPPSVPPPAPQAPPIQTGDWETYRNEEYRFELRHPGDWRVQVTEGPAVPIINIYEEDSTAQLPLTHHSNATHVSIFPEGVPTEGVFSENRDAAIDIGPEVQQAIDYVLSDGTVWASFYGFENPPQGWEPWGFVWAGIEIENEEQKCFREGVEITANMCDPLTGDEVRRLGEINTRNREIEVEILRSLRFL